jgi:hypothetical protein
MRQVYLSLFSLLLSITGFSQQKSSVKWGEEFKLRKGTTGLNVILADKTGAYLQESHIVMKSYYVFSATYKQSATLVKVNANLSEVYRHSFNKELKGKEFFQFFACRDNLFIFSTVYSKRDKKLDIFAAKVDKGSGALAGAWKQVSSLPQEKASNSVQLRIAYSADSTNMVIVSSVEGKSRNEYKVQEFDSNLKASGKPIRISNEFEPKKYQLEDLLYTSNHKVILVGRVYEYEEGKRKKEKFLDFDHYNIRLYDENGKQESQINTSIKGKWLVSSKLLQEKNKDLVLAAFYSNDKKARTIDGLLVQRLDVATGKIISTSDKQINNSLLMASQDNAADEDGDDEKAAKDKKPSRDSLRKAQADDEVFSRYVQFKNIFHTSDGGLILLAEEYRSEQFTNQYYTPGTNGTPGRWTTTNYTIFRFGDLVMCKIDSQGNIAWLQVLPKHQVERYTTSQRSGIAATSYFYDWGTFSGLIGPLYSGFGALKTEGKIDIILNDNAKNSAVTQAGDKAKNASNMGKSDCFILSVDEMTGNIHRKKLFSNEGIPTAMPQLGYVTGNDMYLIGRTNRALAKTKIAIGKLSLR